MQTSKEKVVSFETNVKQEFKEIDFDFLNENLHKNESESVVKRDEKNDDKEFMTLRKVVSKDFDDKKNVLEE